MRIGRLSNPPPDGDMTPMIDMVFQLIAFFMVLLNFTEADVDQRVKLPTSELAKPPDGPLEQPLYLHLTRSGLLIVGGNEVALEAAEPKLQLESSLLKRKQQSPADSTVIIRADREAQAGEVQDLIKMCQEAGFEQFVLRAREELDVPVAQ